MSSRGSHRISVARHVYLRTQQHRLRHVKSLVVRNLTLSMLSEMHPHLSANPLAIETHFTLHPTNNPEKVLYKSYPVQKSYNPSWEAVQFNPSEYEKYSASSSFILYVWVRTGNSNEPVLAFERIVDLASLVYLGTLVNKDGSLYPPNSVIVGMYEGYYSHPGVGGVPCPPKITHALEKLLPPHSLLEVNKLEVRDSYIHPTLLQLIGRQEALNQASTAATLAHGNVEALMNVENGWVEKRRERELLRMRIAVLRSQLVEKEREENDERNQLCKLRDELDIMHQTLTINQKGLEQEKDQYKQDYDAYLKKREMLVRVKRNQLLRQKNMISEAAYTFFITELRDKFTICNVILQNSDQLDQHNSVEQPGVALGYVAHLVHHLAQILLVPLQYEICPNGSRSHICDYISDEAIIDDIREFPLFMKGVERALFHYAVHLLNKDIAQIRQHCGYGMSKSMLKRTLPNLKFLVEKVISELSTKSDMTSRQDSFLSSTSVPSVQSSLPVGSPMAVPIGGARKGRDRQEQTSSSSPSTPLISFSAEPEVYSPSLSSMSFQPSEGEGRMPISPQSSHNSVESGEQPFYSGFHVPEHESSLSTLQHRAKQTDLTTHPYNTPATAHQSSVSVLSLVSTLEDNGTPDTIKGLQFNPEHTHVPNSSNTETPPSFAHADLHRVQFSSAGLHPANFTADGFVLGTGDIDNTVHHSSRDDSDELFNGKSDKQMEELMPSSSSNDLFTDTFSDHYKHQQQVIDHSLSTHSTQPPNNKATTTASELDTVPYQQFQHPPIRTGYTKAGLATPHRIGQEEADQQNDNTDNKRTGTSSDKHSSADGQGGLLEQFIDGF